MNTPRKPISLRVLEGLTVAWLLICAAVIVGALLYTPGPQASWARWQAAAQRLEAAHRLQLQQQARERNERDYIAYVQHQCGDEAWFRPRDGASPVCTNKHGRGTGQAFNGVQP